MQELPARLLDNAGLQLQPITLKEERATHGQRGILGKALPSCRHGRDTWNSSNGANDPARDLIAQQVEPRIVGTVLKGGDCHHPGSRRRAMPR